MINKETINKILEKNEEKNLNVHVSFDPRLKFIS